MQHVNSYGVVDIQTLLSHCNLSTTRISGCFNLSMTKRAHKLSDIMGHEGGHGIPCAKGKIYRSPPNPPQAAMDRACPTHRAATSHHRTHQDSPITPGICSVQSRDLNFPRSPWLRYVFPLPLYLGSSPVVSNPIASSLSAKPEFAFNIFPNGDRGSSPLPFSKPGRT
ncbi:uncharacterized protein BDR25DRAFT_358800 [Lindgomyces ingoldianus]|uniref:Uncharacterized protein n=1 Tax=Lindgomyces ingoldianus TaxID=673940 RepID=A0ACB6QJW0_9PLEO|nr:uncharacterized protein BDR25DRAFT_358800 [Lindgomyces ingoldianus]KAF2467244.1 hypothetical protein BDR25DRAFT_358800 [Lindgomyces ingoldianus]